jgi:hypothetical protein
MAFFNKYKKRIILMKLINKLKKLVGINVAEYVIIYTDQLSQSQRMILATKMINKFPGSCRPNRISVGQKTVTITMENDCLTGPQLKKISDDTLSPDKADISEIELNGNVIWSKN